MCCVRPLSTLIPLVAVPKMTSVDGTGFLLFFRQLSQLYQGLGPIDPPPYHEPEAIKFAEPSMAPSLLCDHFDASAPPLCGQPEKKPLEFVGFRLTATQLTEIHNSVTKGMERSRITRMDIVVGLLVRCLSEVEPESKPIDTIMHVVNVCASVTSPVPWLTSRSTAEWVSTQPTQCLTRFFHSPQDYSFREGPILTTTFWSVLRKYASRWRS